MKEVEIKFPVTEYVYRIAFVAKVYEEMLDKYGFKIYEENNKLKKGIKVLVKNK